MAHPRRVAKVQKQIEREVSGLLQNDKVLVRAVRPEVHTSQDTAERWEMDTVGISGFVSVTSVELSNDLQVAKVFLSIMSDKLGRDTAMRNLVGLQGYVRSKLGQTMTLRLTPEVRFESDDSFQRGTDVLGLLDRLSNEEAGIVPRTAPLIDLGPDEQYDWDDEDFDDADALLEDDRLWDDAKPTEPK